MTGDMKRQTKDGFETVDSVDEAHEMLGSLEHEETMLKAVVQGDGLMAGYCDEIRPYELHDDELQVQPPLIGSCHWMDTDALATEIYEKQLPVKVVDWEDRA